MKPVVSDFVKKLQKRIKAKEGQPVEGGADEKIRKLIHERAKKANATKK